MIWKKKPQIPLKKKSSNNETGPIAIKGGEFDGIIIKVSIPQIIGDESDGTCNLSVSYDIIDNQGFENLDNNKQFAQVVSKIIQSIITGKNQNTYEFGKDNTEVVDTGRDVRQEGSSIPEE